MNEFKAEKRHKKMKMMSSSQELLLLLCFVSSNVVYFFFTGMSFRVKSLFLSFSCFVVSQTFVVESGREKSRMLHTLHVQIQAEN